MPQQITSLRAAVIGSLDTTIAVSGQAALERPFPVRIGEEVMIVTGEGLDWPVQRGTYWTPAHQHSANTPVLLLERDELPEQPKPEPPKAPKPRRHIQVAYIATVGEVPMVDPASTRLGA